MFTKNLYDETTFTSPWGIDYMEILRCLLLTPLMVFLDILTSPFQLIAIIIGKIIEKRERRETK